MIIMTPYFINDLTELLAAVLMLSLPIVIVVLVYKRHRNETNRRTEVLLKALDKEGAELPEELLRSLDPPQRSLKERLLGKLLWGVLTLVAGVAVTVSACLKYRSEEEWFSDDGVLFILGVTILAAGVAFLIYFVVARRLMDKELEQEEEAEKKS